MVKTTDQRPCIGITLGDPAGIGPEIAIKALSHDDIYQKCIPVLIGDTLVIEDALKVTNKTFTLNKVSSISGVQGRPGAVDYYPCNIITQKGDYAFGTLGLKSGEAAFQYVIKGIDLALKGEIAAVVTNPLNKEAIHLAGHDFAGHTEILAHYTNTEDYGMLLSAGGSAGLNVIHVTTHVSMRQACDLITEKRVLKVIHLANEALKMMGKKGPGLQWRVLTPILPKTAFLEKRKEKVSFRRLRKPKQKALMLQALYPLIRFL
jgi:4-hydroxythreonine-4-phosphate dehydrogenase